MAKVTVKTFIKRGSHLEPSALKSNGIYAVRYTLPAEKAAGIGTVMEQWGIVALGNEKEIIATWNVGDFNQWCAQTHGNDKLTYFRSSAMERQFAQGYLDHAAEVRNLKENLELVKMSRLEMEVTYEKILSHPLHKFVSWILNIWK